MRFNRISFITLVAGAALGAAAIQALHAQGKPPAYVIVSIDEITDPAGYGALSGRTNEASTAGFKDAGGRYLARTGAITALDGTAPQRFVIIAFDSKDKAQSWYGSAPQKEVTAIRNKTTKAHAFIVEGM